MINVNDLKTGITIVLNDNIFQVLEFLHVKPGKGGAFVRTKLKILELVQLSIILLMLVSKLKKLLF